LKRINLKAIDVVHNLSHRELNISFTESSEKHPNLSGKWFSTEEIKKIAVPKPIFDKLVSNE
jgi:adenine-specific DNA glycosylase